MAKKYYEGDITMDTDWGGKIDEQGNETQLPLSGKQVQGFIKDTFNSKVGYVGYCETTGMYVMTKDQKTFETYDALVRENKESEEAKSLMIGEFRAPYEYAANIEFIDPQSGYKAVSSNDKNVTISFVPSTKDSSGLAFSEAYTGKITCRNGGTIQSKPLIIKRDEGIVTVNIDDIIAKGSNSITVSITGSESGVSSFKAVEIKVIVLSISDTFDISNTYSSSNKTLSLNYKLEVNGSAKVKFFIDYNEVRTISHTVGTDSGVFTYTISNGQYVSGVHHLIYYAEFDDNSSSDVFTTPLYYREFFVDNGDVENTTFISTAYVIPYDKDFIINKKEPYLYNIEQYATITVPFAIYNDKEITQVTIMTSEDGGEFVAKDVVNTYPGNVTNYNVSISHYGEAKIKLVANNAELIIGPFEVSMSSMQMEPVTDALILDFLAKDKDNDKAGFDSWVSNVNGENCHVKFNNFKWTSDSGWNNGRLSIARDTSIEIPFNPFGDTQRLANGMTFEFEFSTKNVYDDNAVVCNIISSANGYPGIKITATEAKFAVNKITEVSTKFKSGENNRISFVIEPKMANDTDWRQRFIKIYVNGVLCGIVVYGNDDTFYQEGAIVKFEGSEKAEIELYAVRFYEKALQHDEILNNYMFFRPTDDEKVTLYKRNDIYTDGSIDIEKIRQQLPVMIFYQRSESEGKIEDIETEYTDKKKTVYFDVEYFHNKDSKYDFKIERAYITPQGTSSMKYPRKNFRLYTNKDDKTVFYDYDGKVVEDRKYSFTANESGTIEAPKVDCWCLKADFAESSGTHNTGTARYWETVLKEAKILTKSQEKANKINYTQDVRTTVDGFPIVLLYKSLTDDKPRLVGKYNFNNDKSTEDVFGFTGGPKDENKEIKYVPIGKTAPQINKDKYKTIGSYTTTPTEKSPLFAKDASGMYYMLQTKDMFDNPRMECWELLDSSSLIALFVTTEGWAIDSKKNEKIGRIIEDGTFEEAFESRFPDCGDYYHTNELKRFCEWLVSCRYLKINKENNQAVEMTPDELSGETEETTLTIKSLTQQKDYDNYAYTNRNGETRTYNFWEGVTFTNTAEYRKLKFHIEKYDHFDMEKMAAYYIYLMRFGGVDQTVKNAMLTTEGPADENRYDLPSLWYFINYDNDTILGVKNTGHLKHDPYISRTTFEEGTTIDSYAGRMSTLWNNFENDEEFMAKVSSVDADLHKSTSGLSYRNAIDMYNNKQAAQWCERLYNLDAQTKYITTYVSPSSESTNAGDDATLDYLFNVQGPRSAHRKWWLSKRFNIYDSIFSTGDYLNQLIQVKLDGLDSDAKIYITSGEDIYYGYGLNSGEAFKTPTTIRPGETCELIMPQNINYGSPISIYAAVNIEAINLREVSYKMTQLEVDKTYTQSLGTKLKTLLLGDKDKPFFNMSNLTTIAGHGVMEKLEVFDITGMYKMSSLENLYKLKNLKKFYAAGTNVESISFSDGGVIEEIEASSSTTSLRFVETTNLTWDNIRFYDMNYAEDGKTVVKTLNTSFANLHSLTLNEVPSLLNDYLPVLTWLNIKADEGESIQVFRLELNGIDWRIPKSELDKLWVLSEVGREGNTRNIRGKIHIIDDATGGYATITQEEASKFIAIFKDNCFEEGASVQILTQPNIFVNGPDSILEGDDYIEYKIVKVGLTNGTITPNCYERLRNDYNETQLGNGGHFEYNKMNDVIKIKLDEVKRDIESIILRVNFSPSDNTAGKSATKTITVNKRDYPTKAIVSGKTSLNVVNEEVKYTLTLLDDNDNTELNGNFNVEWSLSGEAFDAGYVSIIDSDKTSCTVKPTYLFNSSFNINATVTRIIEGETIELCVGIFKASIKDNSVLIIPQDNPALFWLLYDNGFVNDDKKITYQQVSSINLNTTGNSNLTFKELFSKVSTVVHDGKEYQFSSFNELQYFTNISQIYESMFNNCSKLREISLPENTNYIGNNAFNGCSALKKIILPVSLTGIGETAFNGCTSLTDIEIPNNVNSLGDSVFKGCSQLETVKLGSSITKIPYAMCSGCENLIEVTNMESIEEIDFNAFYECKNLTSLKLSNALKLINFNSNTTNNVNPFALCYKLTFEGGNNTYVVEDGTLYFNDVTNSKKWVIRHNPTKGLKTDEEIYLANYSLNGMTVNNVVVGNNVYISGREVFNGATGDTVTLSNTITNNRGYDCSYLFANSLYKNYNFAIGETVIPQYCFSNVSTIRDITLPETIQEIKNNAFEKCTSLTKITIPSSVTIMGAGVFSETYTSYGPVLQEIIMQPITPPTLPTNGELLSNISTLSVIVSGDSYDDYINHEKWGVYKRYIKINTLPKEGYFRIIKDGEVHFSDNEIGDIVSDVTIGGESVIQQYNGYYKFTTNGNNSDLTIKLNDIIIGNFINNYCTIYNGSKNDLLYSGNGVDFTRGIITMEILQNLCLSSNEGKWIIDKDFGALRTPKNASHSRSYAIGLKLNKYKNEDGKIRIKYGRLAEEGATRERLVISSSTNSNITTIPYNTYGDNIYITASNDPNEVYTFTWYKDINKSLYLDCFWIETIGEPIYNDPQLPENYTVNVKINVSSGQGDKKVLVGKTLTITNDSYFNKVFTLDENGSVNVRLPKNEVFTIKLHTFNEGSKTYFAPEDVRITTNSDIEQTMNYFTFNGIYGITSNGEIESINTSKNYIAILYAEISNDYYILKDTQNAKWIRTALSDGGDIEYTAEEELFLKNTDGLINSKTIYSKHSTNALAVSQAINVNVLTNMIEWYLPSYDELYVGINNEDIVGALTTIGSSSDATATLWTSNTSGQGYAWAIKKDSSPLNESRETTHKIRIFGRRKI